jgi:hypothetical protein
MKSMIYNRISSHAICADQASLLNRERRSVPGALAETDTPTLVECRGAAFR